MHGQIDRMAPRISMQDNNEENLKNLNWDLWLGPAEYTKYTSQLHPFNWRGWWNYGTGALGDMGCHILDAPYKTHRFTLSYRCRVQC